MKLGLRRHSSGSCSLSEEAARLVEKYAIRKNLELNKALTELVEKGYQQYRLEETYGEGINNRELWDRRFYYLKIESGYLYYRLRLSEVVEEMKNLILIMSGLIGDLESCYKTCLGRSRLVLEEEEKLRSLRETLNRYFDRYINVVREELGKKKYVDDREVIKSIEETIRKYKEEFHLEEKEKMLRPDTGKGA